MRGFLGVGIESIDKKWQEAYDLKAPEGALVTSVEPGKPAEKAGLKREDIITKVDDVAVKNNRDLIDYVSGKGPGHEGDDRVPPRRQGEDGRRDARGAAEAGEKPAKDEEDSKAGKQKMLGLELDELTPQARRAYGLDREIQKGVLITHVKPVSPAGDANLQEGDVILEVNGTAVGSVEELQAQIRKAPKGEVRPLLRPARRRARTGAEIPRGGEARMTMRDRRSPGGFRLLLLLSPRPELVFAGAPESRRTRWREGAVRPRRTPRRRPRRTRSSNPRFARFSWLTARRATSPGGGCTRGCPSTTRRSSRRTSRA